MTWKTIPIFYLVFYVTFDVVFYVIFDVVFDVLFSLEEASTIYIRSFIGYRNWEMLIGKRTIVQ